MTATRVLYTLFLICLTVFPGKPVLADSEAATELFNKANEEQIEGNWDLALSLFQELIDRFPESIYSDDAEFRIGYCLEQKGGHNLEAFLAYERLITSYPNSPWVDDAQIHKLSVAETLVGEGNKAYQEYLVEQMESEEEGIRYRAILIVGRLGDERAIPYLKKIQEHATFGKQAASLIEQLESGTYEPPATTMKQKRGLTFDATRERPERETEPEEDEKYGFLFTPTRDYRHYRMMLRDDNQWTRDELIDFGMWTILSVDEFQEYSSYSGYDRSEWLRKYWKRRDPTPTTEENEAWLEFEKRVLEARAQFGQLWNAKHLKYLRDQHNRAGWPNAPWDARGELFIKYGEPDFISFSDFNVMEWTYYRLGVDFLVSLYMTNIYGNAIEPGPLSISNHGDRIFWFESTYEYGKDYIYKHNYGANPLDDVEVNIFSDPVENDSTLLITYTFPAKQLSSPFFSKKATFTESWIVLDEDMKPYRQDEIIREINKKEINEITGKITLNVPPGNYLIALRLKDNHSDKLGIFIETMEVSKEQQRPSASE